MSDLRDHSQDCEHGNRYRCFWTEPGQRVPCPAGQIVTDNDLRLLWLDLHGRDFVVLGLTDD